MNPISRTSKKWVVLMSCVLGMAGADASPANPTLVATITVGRNPVGVAVDPTTGRVFVANAVDDTVTMINEATLAVIGTIPVGDNPQGIAVNPVTHRAYGTSIAGMSR